MASVLQVADNDNAGATGTVTFANPLTPGSLIVVIAHVFDNSDNGINTPTDTAGNTYVSNITGGADVNPGGTAGFRANTWRALNSTSQASNQISITGADFWAIQALEIEGWDTSTPLDVATVTNTASDSTSGTRVLTGAEITPATNGALLISSVGGHINDISDPTNITEPTQGGTWTSAGESLNFGATNWGATAYLTWETADGGITPVWQVTHSGTATYNYYVITTAIRPGEVAEIEQQAYRFRNDDGSETTATWRKSENIADTAEIGEQLRLRIGLATAGDAPSTQYRLEYKEDSSSDWLPIGAGAPGSTTPTIVGSGAAALTTNDPSVDLSTGGWTPAEGDVVFFFISSTTTLAVAGTAGWENPLGGTTAVNTDAHGSCAAYHVVTAGEAGGSTTFTASNYLSAAETGNVVAVAIRGCDPTNPVLAAQSTLNSGNTVTPGVLSALSGGNQPTQTGGLIVRAISQDSTATYTTPGGHTQRVTFNTNNGVWLGTRDTATSAGADVAAQNITPDAGDEYASITVAFRPAPAEPPIDVATSTNFANGDATTEQLTATGTFTAGVMVEDTATANAVDIADGGDTEIEWVFVVQAPAVNDDVYQFRVTVAGTPLTTYTQTPQLTIGEGGITGAGAITGGADDATGSGNFDPPAIEGSGAIAEDVDDATGTGDYTPPPITGTAAISEDADDATGVGIFDTPGFDGSGAITEADDDATGAGEFTPAPITGTGAIIEDQDDATGVGDFEQFEVIGTGAITGGTDDATGAGDFTPPPRSGSGTITEDTDDVVGVGVTAGLWPTTISANGRFIEDQFGNPWFGVGDTCWSLCVQPTLAQAEAYFDDCQDKGINLILANIIEHEFSSQTPADENVNGDRPFTGIAFQSTLNDAYWDHIEAMTAAALQRGITIMWCPAYLGFAGTEEGWDTEVVAASNAQMTTYGQALATRFAGYPNIIWLIGHDKTPSATEEAREAALSDALQAGTTHLVTVAGVEQLGSDAWEGSGVDYDFDTVYFRNDNEGALHTQAGWNATPTMPTGFLEGRYENDGISAAALRGLMYGPLCAGATYVIFGNNPLWNGGSEGAGWTDADDEFDSTGRQNLATFADAVALIGEAWAAMSPDTTDTFLTSGEGTGATRAAARFGTQTLHIVAIAYRPSGGSATLTFDLAELTPSQVRVSKFDPTNATVTAIDVYDTTGAQAIGSLGNNAAGQSDWLLLFEAAPAAIGVVNEAGDDVTGTGTFTLPDVDGSGVVIGDDDTVAGAGEFNPPGVDGSATITEDRDVAAGTATFDPPTVTGAGAITEDDDTVAASGDFVPEPITGSAAIVENADVAAGLGFTGVPQFTGSGLVIELHDDPTGVGVYTPVPITGVGVIVEARDIALGVGDNTPPPIVGSGTILEDVDVIVSLGFLADVRPTITGPLTTKVADGVRASVKVDFDRGTRVMETEVIV